MKSWLPPQNSIWAFRISEVRCETPHLESVLQRQPKTWTPELSEKLEQSDICFQMMDIQTWCQLESAAVWKEDWRVLKCWALWMQALLSLCAVHGSLWSVMLKWAHPHKPHALLAGDPIPSHTCCSQYSSECRTDRLACASFPNWVTFCNHERVIMIILVDPPTALLLDPYYTAVAVQPWSTS